MTQRSRSTKRTFDVLAEREALNSALLSAAATMASGLGRGEVLERTCSALAGASKHISRAWVAPRSHNTRRYRRKVRPPAGTLARRIAAGDASLKLGRHQALCLPIDAAEPAVIYIYVDVPDYFDRIGLDPFVTFAEFCGVVLHQVMERDQLVHQARHDSLTDLFNRSALQTVLEREHARSQRARTEYALLLVDMDRFKAINDTYGHLVGDAVLKEFAARAQTALRYGDWLGRWGGEEFLAILPRTGQAAATAVAERIRVRMSQEAFQAGGHEIRVTVSIGVATCPREGQSPSAVLAAADAALYAAKHSGRNRVRGGGKASRRVRITARLLDKALQDGGIQVAFQPVVRADTGEQVGERALARIVSGNKVIPAQRFIATAYQLAMAHAIDKAVFQKVLQRCVDNAHAGCPYYQFVKLSADTLRRPDILRKLLNAADVAAQRGIMDGGPAMVMDITQRHHITVEEAYKALHPFIERGFGLAIDDFGTGHASLRYLTELPVGFLKIEGHLVRRLKTDPKVRVVLACMHESARQLNMISIADWVEDIETLDRLRDAGIDWVQGYFIGPPRPAV